MKKQVLVPGDVVEVSVHGISNVLCVGVVLQGELADPDHVTLAIDTSHLLGGGLLFQRYETRWTRPLYRLKNGGLEDFRLGYYNSQSQHLYERSLEFIENAIEEQLRSVISGENRLAAEAIGAIESLAEGRATETLIGLLVHVPLARTGAALETLRTFHVSEGSIQDTTGPPDVESGPSRFGTEEALVDAIRSGFEIKGHRDGVIARLRAFPSVHSLWDDDWVDDKIGDWRITSWHPVFASTSPPLLAYLQSLDDTLRYAGDPDGNGSGIPHLSSVLTPLKNDVTLNGCCSHRDELFSGVALHKAYGNVCFARSKREGESIPDLGMELADGTPLEIELSSLFGVKPFEEMIYWVQAAIAQARHASDYSVRLEYPDDSIAPISKEIEDLALQVYVALDDDAPRNATAAVEIAGLPKLGVTVSAERVSPGRGGFVFSPPDEEDFVDQEQLISGFESVVLVPLKKKVACEAKQLSHEQHRNVVALNLVHFAGIANVLRSKAVSDAFQQMAEGHGITWDLNSNDLPDHIDAVVLFWRDFYGRTLRAAEVYKNPSRSWSCSAEAGRIYQLLTE